MYLPTLFMSLPLVINILINNVRPMFLDVVQKPGILIHPQIRVSRFPRLFLQHIHHYILNKT